VSAGLSLHPASRGIRPSMNGRCEELPSMFYCSFLLTTTKAPNIAETELAKPNIFRLISPNKPKLKIPCLETCKRLDCLTLRKGADMASTTWWKC